jgi:S-adenosyl methyltransferase
MAPSDDLPEGLERSKPNAARLYNGYLGGQRIRKADREFLDRVEKMFPNAAVNAGENRKALLRGVRWAVSQGAAQVIDLGAGVPSHPSIHSAARSANPETRVVYVDHEAVACHEIQHSIAGAAGLGVVRADIRDVDAVLNDEVTTRLLDPAQPIVLVIGALLHFVPDEQDPAALLAAYREAVAPGSYLIITHGTCELGQESDMRTLAGMYRNELNIPVTYRGRDELATLLDGYTVVADGIVPVPLLLPAPEDPFDGDPWKSLMYGMIARS